MTSLVVCLYGDSGTGKTPTSWTAVAPVLVLDTEGGSDFVPGKRISWSPDREAPPAAGDWTHCVVQCRDWNTFEQAYKYLHSGQHPFRSVVVDSLSELQKRCRDGIMLQSGDPTLNERQWGVLLVRMEKVVREMRDLKMHPVKPLDTIVLVCLADEFAGKKMPLIQGGLRKSLPGFVDILGHVSADISGNVSMCVQPRATAMAKDRTTVLPADIGAPFNLEDLRLFVNNALEAKQ